MKTAAVIAATFLALTGFSFSQTGDYDRGARDTLSLVISTPPAEGVKVPVVIEAWVYNDEDILAFSAGFSWNNGNMHLDSARVANFLRSTGISYYLFYDDDFNTSNQYRKFQFGGLCWENEIEAFPQSGRKWATYYFTIDNWQSGDSISINMLPDSDINFTFVTSGPIYPLEFQPSFGGPLLFPGIVTSIEDGPIIPNSFTLYQNYPNPFNPETTIEFSLQKKSQVVLEIYNILGQRVSILDRGTRSAGTYRLTWDGKSDAGVVMPSGIYFYRLKDSDQSITRTRKMALIR